MNDEGGNGLIPDNLVQDGLRREDFTEERLAELLREARRLGGFPMLAAEEREANRRAGLASLRPQESRWVFGDGSLMWNPACHTCEQRVGRVHGWHRRFCLWTPLGRGTPEHPGLMLALDSGGSCNGLAFRIPPDLVESESEVVWRREMLSGAYRPTWVRVHTGEGPVRAVTFTINRNHPRFDAAITHRQAVTAIATAEGRLGRSRDYLGNLVLQLRHLGVHDRAMERLHADVNQHAGTAP